MAKIRKVYLPKNWVAIRNRKTKEIRFYPQKESK